MFRTPEQRRIYNEKYYADPKNREKILEGKKEYYQRNKEVINQKQAVAYQKNKEVQKQKTQDYYSLPENRRKKLFMKARERANEDGLEFTITIDDIIIPEYCPYLGFKLTHELGQGQLPTNSSIDRIDNLKGYVPGNVQVTSRLANSMKTSSSREERESFARAVLNNPLL